MPMRARCSSPRSTSHLDERVRSRIVAETRGNPLALLELPRAMTPAELAGGYGVPEAMPMASRIEQGFRRRLESLPPQTRRLLLTAAAEPVGDATLVWRAAERLGIGVEAAAAASEAGLLEIDGRVRFRHPLVRSAAYRASAPPERQEVHRALADATDPERDPDRRAWHRAHATDRPDEDVAAELERSASRAAARGGIAAAAAFLERAAELTPDPASRGARALAAAQAKFESAAPDAALELLALAELCPLEELERARLERLRAEIVFARTRGRDAPALLLDAARRLDPLDAAMARETYLEAMVAAMFAGRLGDGPGVREAAEAARAGPAAPQPPRAVDLLVDGLATRFAEGYAAGVPPLRKALAAFRDVNGSTARDQRWFWLACRLAQDLWDDELWYVLATRGVRVARETGMLSVLPNAVTHRAALYVHAGAFGAASSLIEEADAITQATEMAPLKYATFMLAAWRGHEADALAMIEAGRIEATARGEGLGLSVSEWITGAALQRSRPLPGRARRSRAGVRGRRRRELRVGPGGADRGGRPQRRDGRDLRRARSPERAHAGERHRLGARDPGTVTGAAERGRRRRRALPRGDRAARAHPDPRRARPRPSALRGVAAPRAAPGRRTRAVARRARDVHRDGRRRVRRACSRRAAGHG